MKLTVLALTISLNVFASFFVESCSTADARFTSVTGHLPTKTQYTVVNPRTGDSKVVVIKDFETKTLSSSTIKESSSKVCDGNSRTGYISWTNYKLVKKVITLKGDELFPTDLAGTSEDQKSLTVTLLCKFDGNSRTQCK